ncbi:MAG: hypothetical protein EXS05_08980 [Planctomycetaceae bacterium]|nr:hypothetical protein [Planctomycetaceae bacterium]
MSWLHLEMTLLDAARGTTTLALNWLWQSTLLLCAGLALARLLKQRGSAAQSVVYSTTLTAVLVCPLLTWAISQAGVSGWSLEMPPAWTQQQQERPIAISASSAPRIPDPEVLPVHNPGAPADRAQTAGMQPTEYRTNELSAAMRPLELTAGNPPDIGASQVPQGPATERSASAPASSSPGFSIQPFGLFAVVGNLVWMLITAWLLARLAVAWWRLAAIRRGALPTDEATIRLCRELSVQLGVGPPAVLHTPFLPSPCLAGMIDPAVLLPEAELTLSIRDVLIHELAHLRRRDGHWNLLRKLATSLFWFQPLLWKLSGRLEMAAEEVCDDCVVATGGDRSEYANRLVDVAEFSGVPMATAGVAIVSLRSMLAQRVARIMDTSRRLSTGTSRRLLAGALTGGCLGTLVIGFVGAGPRVLPEGAIVDRQVAAAPQPGEPAKKQPNSRTEAAASPAGDRLLPAKEQIGEKFIVRGKVNTPDGKPAVGARVSVRKYYFTARVEWRSVATATADSDGRFEISFGRSPMDGIYANDVEWVTVAEADGFGTQWISWTEIKPSEVLVLKLVPDFPIRGRVTDLEGRPIAGVRVRVLSVEAAKPGEDLTPWIESVKTGAIRNVTGQKLGSSVPGAPDDNQSVIATDREGRFVLKGIGAERVAEIELQGDSIAYRKLSIATRTMPPLTRALWFHSGINKPPTRDQVFGADFTYAAIPTKVLEGTIRDAASGQPLADVEIESDHLAGMQVHPHDVLRTRTDANGRYRLVGLPKGDGPNLADFNTVLVKSQGEAPYLMREITVPSSPGIGPQTLDIELHRGLWITGRVTEKSTGKPVRARFFYMPFRDNPFTLNRPEFHSDGNMDHDQHQFFSDSDGKFRLPGLPGHAIVAARAIRGDYLSGVGAAEIQGRTKSGDFPTYRAPFSADPRFVNAMKEINPSEGTASVTCDLVFDSGEKVQVTAVDGEGKPIAGCTIRGRVPHGYETSQPATFDVTNLAPDEPRDLMIVHTERNLGKLLKVTFKPDAPRALTVILEPCATIKGRLVDQDGVPFKALEVSAHPSSEFRLTTGDPQIACNSDGTFECPHLPTGCEHYSLGAMGEAVGYETIAEKLVVQPGQTVDLGDVKLKSKK